MRHLLVFTTVVSLASPLACGDDDAANTPAPDTAGPDTTLPDSAGPDTAGPDTTTLDTAQTDTSATDTVETDTTATDSTEDTSPQLPTVAPSLGDLDQRYRRYLDITPLPFVNSGGGSITACTATDLPPGLSVAPSVDGTTCVVTGRPVSLQMFVPYTVTATNAVGSDDATLSVAVTDGGPITCYGLYEASGVKFSFLPSGRYIFRGGGFTFDGDYGLIEDYSLIAFNDNFDPRELTARFAPDCATVRMTGSTSATLNRQASKCGDGVLDADEGEVCDDGDTSRCGGTCASDCSRVLTGCGDGVVCGDEGCDDEAASLWCTATCEEAPCGDGVVDAGEACDDGGRLPGDGCRADCLGEETCGDGYLDVARGEVCDDGNDVPGDGCDGDCMAEPGCRCAVPGSACTEAFGSNFRYEINWQEFVADLGNGISTIYSPWTLEVSGEGFDVVRGNAEYYLRPAGSVRGVYNIERRTSTTSSAPAKVLGAVAGVVVGADPSPTVSEDTNYQWEVVFDSALRGFPAYSVDRFTVRSVGGGDYLCGGTDPLGGNLTLSQTPCTWIVAGKVGSTVCAPPAP